MVSFLCRLKTLSSDRRGATAIEFAIIVPIFLFITFFFIEIALICFSAIAIENSVSSTMRLGKLGITGGMGRDAFIRQEIVRRSFGLIDANKIVINAYVAGQGTPPPKNPLPERCIEANGDYGSQCPCATGQVFDDRNGNGVCDGAQTKLDLGQPGQLVVYTVTYPWRQITPFVSFSRLFGGVNLGERGEVLLYSGGIVRNEPA